MTTAGRDPWFTALQHALHDAGIAWPVLVVDRARLDHNIDVLASGLPDGMALRVVAKSLPCIPLLQRVRARVGTDRVMTFNLAMLRALAVAMPDVDQLLGKPLPVAAARAFLTAPLDEGHPVGATVADRVQWLIDTPRRLDQYARLARDHDVVVRASLELDVGLHRGGFLPDGSLRGALQRIDADPSLTFAGFLGYEPHVAHLPSVLGLRDRALQQAWTTYRAALRVGRDVLGAQQVDAAVRNAGGSPTHRLYRDTEVANEVAVGSVLVKPSDFDLVDLGAYLPAAFIATPVLKRWAGSQVPGLSQLDRVASALPGRGTSLYIHGGNWMADPVDPPGLRTNPVVGRSSNQELLNGPGDVRVEVDDFVFLRPTQSEAVLLQFGDLVVVDDGQVVDTWPVLAPSA